MTSSSSLSYQEFIESKLVLNEPAGFAPSELPDGLFDFQAAIVDWAVRRGRAAIFADTGLGKTRMQLAWADQVARHTGLPVLILAPLCVAQQTVREAQAMGIADVRYARTKALVIGARIVVVNYEMLEHFNPEAFGGVVLDESSILKNFTGKTKQLLIAQFEKTPYKLACTATPAPNDYLELGNHAEFLGIMPSNEMISRFFINDSMAAGSYRLKSHGRADFWRWCASWSVAITRPSDMGYSDEGYNLPPLTLRHISVSTEGLPPVEGHLFRDTVLSATNLHKEMRLTAPMRADAAAALIAKEPDETWLIWCNTNYEADELTRRLTTAVEVRGAMSPEQKAQKLTSFIDGSEKILITKPSVAGFGLNLQHCARVIFVGLSYSYEDFYQAVRRCYRFGQKREVKAFVIAADSEMCVMETIQRKEEEHKKMQKEMSAEVSMFHENLQRPPCLSVVAAKGDAWTLYQGDCVIAMREMASDSVGLSVYSPPFANLYIYSDSLNDMGNARDTAEFLEQYRFAARELFRVTKPGRLCVIHCKDLPLYKNRDGAAGLYDFPGDLRRVHEEEGWVYHSRVTIWKDPVIEMQRTKNHGLLYKQLCKDSAASRQGMADYLIVMRKWANPEKWEAVTRGGERFFDYVGSTCQSPGKKEIARGRDDKERQRLYSINVWQRYASPVWFDVNQTRCLNVQQARDGQDEKHICPLQLDVIERSIELWSNPGDLVLSPFAGIGSEGYVALQMGRRFIGAELKPSYWEVAKRNLKAAEREQGGLFAEAMEDAA
jgi:DNA modification methylase/superfamily II DNA or RNA helicase